MMSGRVFGALFTKLGVPIPTQIVPKVLAQARDIVEKRPTDAMVRVLHPGIAVDGYIGKQEAAFFSFSVDESFKNGVMLICRSSSMSKFKLVLFDKEGAVRKLQDSDKKRNYTAAEMYFVGKDRANYVELIPFKALMEDKDTPLQFHLLDGLEREGGSRLDDREHLIAVYGDNWIKQVKYHLQFLPVSVMGMEPLKAIEQLERSLLEKKSEMTQFQTEFLEVKKRYEEATMRLKAETEEITTLLKQREKCYDDLLDFSTKPFQSQVVTPKQEKGFLSSIFG